MLKNININCVSPGFIQTAMTDKINDEFKKTLISKIPSGNLGTGEDVSNCVAFLASDMANYINGETVHVNGGMYMAWTILFNNLIRKYIHKKGIHVRRYKKTKSRKIVWIIWV